MTIAVCVVVPEGVVFCADSVATISEHKRLDHEQKIFQVGSCGNLAVMTWGRGRFGTTSIRTAVAEASSELSALPEAGIFAAASQLSATLWSVYDREVRKDRKNDATDEPNIGFCLGGYEPSDRVPKAFAIELSCDLIEAPAPRPIEIIAAWGWTGILDRMLGLDRSLIDKIHGSGKWAGNPDELEKLWDDNQLTFNYPLPIREAVDLAHAIVYATVKFHKFTVLPSACGGLVEVAVIPTDGFFRWVQHADIFDAIGSG